MVISPLSSDNPYTPPPIPAEAIEPLWPTSGLYSDNFSLVMHHTAGLPMVCLKTDKPADVVHVVELKVLQTFDESVPPWKRTFWTKRPIHKLGIPLSHAWLARQRWWRRLGMLVAVSGVILILAGLLYAVIGPGPRYAPRTAGVVGALVGLIVFLIGISIRDAFKSVVQLPYVAGGFFWIGGVSNSYLAGLPVWPVPKPTFWEQMWRWNPNAPVPPKPIEAEVLATNDP